MGSNTQAEKRSIHVFLCPGPRSASIRAHISGVSVSETTPEAMIATMIVTANSWKMRPSRPGMNTSGMNTAASESVIERIVKLISFAPLNVAVSAFSPLSMRRTVFSRNTIASSTRKPIASVSAMQREVVEAVAEHPHDDERQQQRQRQRDDRDERVGRAPEEHEDDDDDEHERDEQRLLHVFDRVHDRLRAVVDRDEPDGAWQLACAIAAAARARCFATSTAFAPACRETASTTIEAGGLTPRNQKRR